MNIHKVLSSKYSHCRYNCSGTYPNHTLEWLDSEHAEPTEQELLDAEVLIASEEAATLYRKQRKEAYPRKCELTVALWELVVESDSLSADELQAKRLAVKAMYPKPEA